MGSPFQHTHNINQIHNSVLWDWQYSAEYSIIQTLCEKYSAEDSQSHITWSWIWIMLCPRHIYKHTLDSNRGPCKIWRPQRLQDEIFYFNLSFVRGAGFDVEWCNVFTGMQQGGCLYQRYIFTKKFRHTMSQTHTQSVNKLDNWHAT